MQKTKEKCCADCKHCIIYDTEVACAKIYKCGKTANRDRITGNNEYKDCGFVIDTSTCEFEDATRQRFIIHIVCWIVILGVTFFVGWNIL